MFVSLVRELLLIKLWELLMFRFNFWVDFFLKRIFGVDVNLFYFFLIFCLKDDLGSIRVVFNL